MANLDIELNPIAAYSKLMNRGNFSMERSKGVFDMPKFAKGPLSAKAVLTARHIYHRRWDSVAAIRNPVWQIKGPNFLPAAAHP